MEMKGLVIKWLTNPNIYQHDTELLYHCVQISQNNILWQFSTTPVPWASEKAGSWRREGCGTLANKAPHSSPVDLYGQRLEQGDTAFPQPFRHTGATSVYTGGSASSCGCHSVMLIFVSSGQLRSDITKHQTYGIPRKRVWQHSLCVRTFAFPFVKLPQEVLF